MTREASPYVSVVIPVYNDRERLALCLDALAAQSYPMDRVEVLVVDNGSDEPPEEVVARHPFSRLLHESKPGSYCARNRALEEAQGELLAFTDSDCLPSREWLKSGIALVESHDGGAVVGGAIEVFALDEQNPTAVELYDIAHGLRQESYVNNAHYAATANLFTSRRVMESVGAFNGLLKSSGDSEWGQRAHADGWPIVFSAQALIRHPARRSLRAIITKARRHAGGRMDYMKVRKDRPSLLRRVRLAIGALLPHFRPIFQSRARLTARGYGIGSWLKASCVLLVLQYTRAFEMIRKRLGGGSVRS